MKHKKSVLKILSANSECFRASAGIAPNGSGIGDARNLETLNYKQVTMPKPLLIRTDGIYPPGAYAFEDRITGKQDRKSVV